MQISLRSHLIAGTAAVVGASAIAMTPVMGAQLSLPSISTPSVAKVALAGFDSPISELLGSIILGGQLLFNTDALPGRSWGPTAFAQPGIRFLPAAWWAVPCQSDRNLPSVGLIPQIIDDALPIISPAWLQRLGLPQRRRRGSVCRRRRAERGRRNAAGALLTRTSRALLADPPVGSALPAPWHSVPAPTCSPTWWLGHSRDRRGSGLAAHSARRHLGADQPGGGALYQVVTDTFAATTFEVERRVDGIFGATGVPGTILNLTIGAGQQVAPITAFNPVTGEYTPSDAFVPSTRTLVQGAVKSRRCADGDAPALPLPRRLKLRRHRRRPLARRRLSVRTWPRRLRLRLRLAATAARRLQSATAPRRLRPLRLPRCRSSPGCRSSSGC